MSTIEPSIKIFRSGKKLKSIYVAMPVSSERSYDGSLKVYLPLFGIQTWANDESEIEKAVEITVLLFCRGAEKIGKGIDKELQSAGWKIIEDKLEERVLSFNISNSKVIPFIIWKGRRPFEKERLQFVKYCRDR